MGVLNQEISPSAFSGCEFSSWTRDTANEKDVIAAAKSLQSRCSIPSLFAPTTLAMQERRYVESRRQLMVTVAALWMSCTAADFDGCSILCTFCSCKCTDRLFYNFWLLDSVGIETGESQARIAVRVRSLHPILKFTASMFTASMVLQSQHAENRIAWFNNPTWLSSQRSNIRFGGRGIGAFVCNFIFATMILFMGLPIKSLRGLFSESHQRPPRTDRRSRVLSSSGESQVRLRATPDFPKSKTPFALLDHQRVKSELQQLQHVGICGRASAISIDEDMVYFGS